MIAAQNATRAFPSSPTISLVDRARPFGRPPGLPDVPGLNCVVSRGTCYRPDLRRRMQDKVTAAGAVPPPRVSRGRLTNSTRRRKGLACCTGHLVPVVGRVDAGPLLGTPVAVRPAPDADPIDRDPEALPFLVA